MSLINYGTIMNPGKDPIMVFEFDGKNTVTLTGPKENVANFRSYFSNTKGGWDSHLEQENPLESFAANWSHGRNESVADKKKVAEAKKSILKRGGEEVTVSWESSD